MPRETTVYEAAGGMAFFARRSPGRTLRPRVAQRLQAYFESAAEAMRNRDA